jgi:polyphosphate kinase 2
MAGEFSPEVHAALMRRIELDLVDGLDEEIELELEDRSLDPLAEQTDDDRRARNTYFKNLFRLQGELVKVQDWVAATRHKVIIVFEGRDAAGKGGVIKRITQRLNPRVCRTVALPAPNDRERTQWYFQRYVPHLPAAGEMVLFDRSWYNRAGVEAIMGFCTPAQTAAFLKQAPRFERLLVDDGILLFKYWLTVDQAEQEERFTERLADPLKRWKLSPIDIQARRRYGDYGRARDRMLKATHNKHTPWTLVDFNDQRRGRLTLISDLLARVPDRHVPLPTIKFPPLHGKPMKEKFRGPLRPLASV